MNPKQQAFVRAYLGSAHGNATKAAIAAGYSERSAHVQGCELLKHPKVREAIDKRAEKADITAESILQELRSVAFAQVDLKGSDKLKALDLLGKYRKLWNDGGQAHERIVIQVGFLADNLPDPYADVKVIDVTPPTPELLPAGAHVAPPEE